MANGKTVFVVDDDELLSELIVQKLRDSGFEVEAAYDGVEAMTRLESLRPDAVVLDGMMPGMDGFDVLRNMQKDPVLADIPVVMLTARGLGKDVVTGLSLGAKDYMVKPFMPDELVDRLSAIIEGRK